MSMKKKRAKPVNRVLYSYRYVDGRNQPVTHCRNCGSPFTADMGIMVELCSNNGQHHWEVSSRLNTRGELLDPTGDIKRGLHSVTMCSHCREQLIDMNDVIEIPTQTRLVKQKPGPKPKTSKKRKPKYSIRLLKKCADYIVNTEYGYYKEFCEENELDPANLKANSDHAYALAMLALGYKYK